MLGLIFRQARQLRRLPSELLNGKTSEPSVAEIQLLKIYEWIEPYMDDSLNLASALIRSAIYAHAGCASTLSELLPAWTYARWYGEPKRMSDEERSAVIGRQIAEEQRGALFDRMRLGED